MENRAKKVTVVIPNYNGIKFIKNCLNSLANQTEKDFEIIVIDNDSADGSVELVQKEFDNVRLIKLDKNYGFCKAVNEGIKRSLAKYVILLNNDTEVHECFVEELLRVMNQSDEIFSCSAKMLQLYNKDLIDDAGDYYCALGWAFARGKAKPASMFNDNNEIFAACAGAAIYRRELFDEIGHFDEEHFAYLEDIDIGYRARIYGYKNMYAARAIVYHAGSGVSGSAHNEFKVRLASKNSIYMIHKNMPFLQILLNLPFLIIGFLIKTVFFAKKGLGGTYVVGLKKGLQMSIRSKKVRFRVKNLRNYIIIQLELWINMIRRFVY